MGEMSLEKEKKPSNYTNIINEIIEAVNSLDFFSMKAAIKNAIDANIPIIDVIKKGVLTGLEESGEMGLILAAEALGDQIVNLEEESRNSIITNKNYNGKVVIGTIEGDIHSLGKNILIALLKSYGMEVIDLGIDVKPKYFLEAAKRPDVKVIGISFLLSAAEPAIKKVMSLIKSEDYQDKVKVILGGAAVTPEIAKETNADAYALDALEGVDIIDEWLRD